MIMPNRMIQRWLLMILGGISVTMGTACKRDDAERIGRFGRKLHTHLESVTPEMPAGLNRAWETLTDGRPATTERTVRDRLSGDQGLNRCSIEIAQTSPGIVRLTGTVEQPGQKVRAVELARLTIGVTEVVDELTVKP